MATKNNIPGEGGIIHSSIFKESYSGKEHYDHYSVINSGVVSAMDYIGRKKESSIDTRELYSKLKV